MYIRALQGREDALGPDHTSTLTIILYLLNTIYQSLKIELYCLYYATKIKPYCCAGLNVTKLLGNCPGYVTLDLTQRHRMIATGEKYFAH